jgi:hypothetical protein
MALSIRWVRWTRQNLTAGLCSTLSLRLKTGLSGPTSRIEGIVWDFVNQNHSHLEHQGEFEPNKVYPSRRSWERFNNTASPAGVFDEDGDLDLLFNLASAFVGFEAAVAIKDFVEKYEWQVTVERNH